MNVIAYACSSRPNALWSAAQFDSALPKNRAECDTPLVAKSDADAALASASFELDRLRRECSDGLDALSDIDDFWEACPYPDNRKHLSPAEQISSLDSELNKAHDENAHLRERLKAIVDWCDIAMKNADEFESHGVRNLDGPIFDAARAVLAPTA